MRGVHLIGLVRDRARRRLRDRRGAVAVMFAVSAVPLVMSVGLATDYSFYIASRAQINLAADAAALHAVRVASQAYVTGNTYVGTSGNGCNAGNDGKSGNGKTNNGNGNAGNGSSTGCSQQAGATAGAQWFQAQLGTLANAAVPSSNVAVDVVYTASPSSFTATVTFTGTVPTHFGRLFNVSSWPVQGTASSVVSNSYVEVLMLLDDSPSMLLGATTADVLAMQAATPCSAQAANSNGQDMSYYSWNYPSNYGYVSRKSSDPLPPPPPPGSVVGSCDPSFTGDASATPSLCSYFPPKIRVNANGQCTDVAGKVTGGGSVSYCSNGANAAGTACNGGSTIKTVTNVPQAPCGFACHNDAGGNDYFGLARSLKNPAVTLRLDVVQNAAANVISTLQSVRQGPNQFAVGVYQFALNLQPLFPGAGNGEASTDLAGALTAVQNAKNNPPLTPTSIPDTDFPTSANALAGQVTAAGTGAAQATPLKNLFIVTDGMNFVTGSPYKIGPMTSTSNETICQQFKQKGFAVYVLYTPYFPIPDPVYYNLVPGGVSQYAEPTNASPNVQALQACASNPSYFFQASDPTAINGAMQTMLRSALNSAGRISM